MSIILGTNYNMHDASICLVKNGKLEFFAEEERLSRLKHMGWDISRSFKSGLGHMGITSDSIEYIGISFDPWKYGISIIKEVFGSGFGPFWPKVLRARSRSRDFFNFWLGKSDIKRMIPKAQLHIVPHHLAHAASAFLVSPFENAAVLTIDARGEWTTVGLAQGEDNKVKIVERICLPNSLGHLYTAVTEYLGFGAHAEYEVMGLAAYGKPEYRDFFFEKIVKLLPNGRFKLNPEYFSYYSKNYLRTFEPIFGPRRTNGETVTDQQVNLASSVQKVLEEVTLHITKHLHKLTGKSKLCIAGGVGLNSVMNYRLLKESPFDDIFIQPAAGDSGAALGSAFYIHNTVLGNPRTYVMDGVDFGPGFSDEEIQSTLDRCLVKYQSCPDIAKTVAELLVEGKVVGWFQGRMEMGPRALGYRSILADPRKAETKDVLNMAVKFRQEFRPFAPSVLEEEASEFFDIDRPSPYMLMVAPVHPERKSDIPAVTHVDGTARPHTVSRNSNPLYWQVIKEFQNLTGIPVILNTSFNVRGEPVVCKPMDAVRCFYGSGMHALAIGNFLVVKE